MMSTFILQDDCGLMFSSDLVLQLHFYETVLFVFNVVNMSLNKLCFSRNVCAHTNDLLLNTCEQKYIVRCIMTFKNALDLSLEVSFELKQCFKEIT